MAGQRILQANRNCQPAFAAGGEVRPFQRFATVFFRIFQECLTNISRHAHARAVEVSLYEEGEDVVMVVKDDGKGFREGSHTTSLGILGMKERAQSCGGELSIASTIGRGTAVTLRVPLCAAGSKNDAHSD